MDIADRVYAWAALLEENGLSTQDLLPIVAYICPKCGLVETVSAVVHMQEKIRRYGGEPPPARS
jgi:hypothetical protein